MLMILKSVILKEKCSHVFPTAMETKLRLELLITVHQSKLNHQC